MSGELEVRPGLVIPAAELEESASRSSGPGGQHVNKTSTRVTLRWSVATSGAISEEVREKLLQRLQSRLTKDGVLVVNVEDTRSQLANREGARERLATIVREALVEQRKRVRTKPSRGSQRRRIEKKKQKGAIKSLRGRVTD